ncbi:MAG: hypothetical protein MHPSP_004460 [Paramarteilia canceri]
MDILSEVLLLKNDLTQLAFLCRKLLKIEPNSTQACIAVGNFFVACKRSEEAIEWYYKALLINPNYTNAWIWIGHEYMELMNLPASIKAYKNALSIH